MQLVVYCEFQIVSYLLFNYFSQSSVSWIISHILHEVGTNIIVRN
jgi:hypothetical protein